MPSMDIEICISGILVLFIIFKNVSHSSLGCSTKAGAGGSMLAFRLELHSWNCKLQRIEQDRTLKSKNTAVGHAQAPWIWTWYALTSVRNGAALSLRGLAYPEVRPEAIRICRGTQKKTKTTDRFCLCQVLTYFFLLFFKCFPSKLPHLPLPLVLTHLLSGTFAVFLLSFWTQGPEPLLKPSLLYEGS